MLIKYIHGCQLVFLTKGIKWRLRLKASLSKSGNSSNDQRLRISLLIFFDNIWWWSGLSLLIQFTVPTKNETRWQKFSGKPMSVPYSARLLWHSKVNIFTGSFSENPVFTWSETPGLGELEVEVVVVVVVVGVIGDYMCLKLVFEASLEILKSFLVKIVIMTFGYCDKRKRLLLKFFRISGDFPDFREFIDNWGFFWAFEIIFFAKTNQVKVLRFCITDRSTANRA